MCTCVVCRINSIEMVAHYLTSSVLVTNVTRPQNLHLGSNCQQVTVVYTHINLHCNCFAVRFQYIEVEIGFIQLTPG